MSEKPDIKIFVSHRIDITSELVNNPLYIPVRCGAVFDKENPMNIAGDNTGENISEQRSHLSEFTVAYWAWKNQTADYYGLCHYRRYLSFSDLTYPVDTQGLVEEDFLNQETMEKYSLLAPDHMSQIISEYDAVIPQPAPVHLITTPKGPQSNVGDVWRANAGVLIESDTIDRMLELIDQKAPQYSQAAREYLNSTEHRGYNCYVFKRELFDRMCQFQFPILFELEQHPSGRLQRVPGYVGEILFGIFLYHIIHFENWKIKELQLVLFLDTRPVRGACDLWLRRMKRWGDRVLRMLLDPLFPKGSLRRERLKALKSAIQRRGIKIKR